MADDDPYRALDRASPPALLELAARAVARPSELPREAIGLSTRERRLAVATGVRASAVAIAGGVLLLGSIGLLAASIGLGPGAVRWAGAALGAGALGAFWLAIRRNAREVRRMLAELDQLPFPHLGYDLWLISEEPLLDVVLAAPVDQKLLVAAARGVDPEIEVEWIDATRARIAIPPVQLVKDALNAPNMFGGNRRLLRRTLDELLLPLHADVGILRLDMGGRMRGHE